jgi:hypothetical protein
LVSGSSQVCQAIIKDSANNSYTNAWQFYIGTATLPAVITPSYSDVNGGVGIEILSTNSDSWLTNFQENSSGTLWVRFDVRFDNNAGENGSGGMFGGLQFYRNGNQQVLFGNSWVSTNYGLASLTLPPYEQDLLPATPYVLGQWATMVGEINYVSNGLDNITAWLNPNFALLPSLQTNGPTTVQSDASLDTVNLRCGNGTSAADFANIRFAANPTDLGFPGSVVRPFMSLKPGAKPTSVLSWTGSGQLLQATNLLGPWSVSANQANTQTINITNTAMFYRLVVP